MATGGQRSPVARLERTVGGASVETTTRARRRSHGGGCVSLSHEGSAKGFDCKPVDVHHPYEWPVLGEVVVLGELDRAGHTPIAHRRPPDALGIRCRDLWLGRRCDRVVEMHAVELSERRAAPR